MTICERVQELLAEAGVEALDAQPGMAAHFATCPDCRAIAAALDELDARFAELPEVDAPDTLVEATLAEVRKQASGGAAEWRKPGPARRRIAGALAASLVVVAVIGLAQGVLDRRAHDELFGFGGVRELFSAVDGKLSANYGYGGASTTAPDVQTEGEPGTAVEDGRYYAHSATGPSHAEPSRSLRGSFRQEAAEAKRKEAPLARGNFRDPPAPSGERHREAEVFARLRAAPPESQLADKGLVVTGQSKSEIVARRPRPAEEAAVSADRNEARKRAKVVDSLQRSAGHAGQSLAKDQARRGDRVGDDEADEDLASTEAAARPPAAAPVPVGGKRFEYARKAPTAREAARIFLDRLADPNGLVFQPATGYWRNTYVPGDPDMRLLGARLAKWAAEGSALRLDLAREVRPIEQFFDPPRETALALELRADTRAISGPTRLRLQVGLQGTERAGAYRPAMRVALLLDLRRAPDTVTAGRFQALATALERARQPGDEFSLVVAGPEGGLALPADAFRHGALKLVLEDLLDEARPGPGMDLSAAIELAGGHLGAEASAETVLGSSVVLLATAQPLGPDLDAIESLVHGNALRGITTSVVAAGDGIAPESLDRLVAAGQGHRRILARAGAAEALIGRELHASSRTVARAARLRIRLAPGVELVDVLGSERLDGLGAARVREAEAAIDRKLARDLGIVADRGEDEDGIQIVIPNFQAGDAHVVLLDVVAPGPGPIADVTLRFKDVTRLGNGVAHAHLALQNGEPAAGPAEVNVLRNLLAHDFARRARRIGGLIAAGRDGEATAEIARHRTLLQGVAREVPALADDHALAADDRFFAEYRRLIDRRALGPAEARRRVSQSLRYAAFAKLHTAVAGAKSEEDSR